MAGFPMCADCRREYEDPADRRFHAEPIACPACGPQLSLPLEDARRAPPRRRDRRGQGARRLPPRLRRRERRRGRAAARPQAPRGEAVRADDRRPRRRSPISPPRNGRCFASPARPIVLLRRRAGARVAAAVAPGSPWLGVMLPYTPLHHLLAADFAGALVMTSGNVSDEPIAFDDDEARARLGGIADAFLAHDRPIHRRCEDSVVRAGFPVRRSRGLRAGRTAAAGARRRPLVAAGAELKSTFCVARERRGVPLAPPRRPRHRAGATARSGPISSSTSRCSTCEPDVVAHDLHPEYLSTKWALEQDAELVGVQHHHAHAAACLAEHGEDGPGARARLRRHRLRHRRHALGRRAAALRPRGFERLAHLDAGAAARRRGGDPRAVARRGGPPRAWRACPSRWPRWALVRESLKLEPAALLRHGPPVRRGRGRPRRARARELRRAGADRARAARGRPPRRSRTPWRFGDDHRAWSRAAYTTSSRAGRTAAEIAAALPRDRRRGRDRGVRRGRRPAHRRPLRRQLPEPAPARRRPRGGSRQPASASSHTAASRRTTAASATARPPSQQGGSAHVPSGSRPRSSSSSTRGSPREGRDLRRAARSSRTPLCPEVEVGDWVLIHVGFALERIDEEQARETLDLLEQMGEAYEQELREIRGERVAVTPRRRALHHLRRHRRRRHGRGRRRRRPRPSSSTALREQVGIELVEPVAVGDVLLCHAGIALREAPDGAMKFVDEFRSGELAQKLVARARDAGRARPHAASSWRSAAATRTRSTSTASRTSLPPEVELRARPRLPGLRDPDGAGRRRDRARRAARGDLHDLRRHDARARRPRLAARREGPRRRRAHGLLAARRARARPRATPTAR